MSRIRITLSSISLLLVVGTLFFSCSNSKKQENKETTDSSSLGSSNVVGGTTETSGGPWPSDDQWKKVGLPGLKQPAGTKGEYPELYGDERILVAELTNANVSHFNDLRQQMENILGEAPTISEDDYFIHANFYAAHMIGDRWVDIGMAQGGNSITIYCDLAGK